MKIKVYGKDYCEQIRKFVPFVIDTEKYPELTSEVLAIVRASEDGVEPRDMKDIMEDLLIKMWDTQVDMGGDHGGGLAHRMNLAECFEPHEEVEWEKEKNETSWLEFDSIVTGNEEQEPAQAGTGLAEEPTQPSIVVPGTRATWFTDDLEE